MSKLTASEERELAAMLKEAESVTEIIDAFNEFYDLDNCCPGTVVKAALIAGLKKGIAMAKPEIRESEEEEGEEYEWENEDED